MAAFSTPGSCGPRLILLVQRGAFAGTTGTIAVSSARIPGLLRTRLPSSARLINAASRAKQQASPAAVKTAPKPVVSVKTTPFKPAKAPTTPAKPATKSAKPAAAKGSAAPATPKKAGAAPAAPVLAPEQQQQILTSYAETLAKRGRTLLYEAPSHFWYRAMSFGTGLFCVGYSLYHYWTMYLHPPPDLASWVPMAFGVICVCMTGMGTYFLLGTRRIVRSIEAVPATMLRASKQAVKGNAAAASAPSPVYVEVKTQRMFPFLPARKILVRPDEIQMPIRMFGYLPSSAHLKQSSKPVGTAAEVRAKIAERKAKERYRQYQLDHIMTAPFRDAKSVFSRVFEGTRRAFSREGFTQVKIKDDLYKLDVTGGWALDDGKAMDRLLAVRPNELRKLL